MDNQVDNQVDNQEVAVATLPRKFKQLGLTTVEYAVAGGVIVAGIVLLFGTLGGAIQTRIQAIITAL